MALKEETPIFPVRILLDERIPREKIIIDLIKKYPGHSRVKTALLRESLLSGLGSAMQLYPSKGFSPDASDSQNTHDTTSRKRDTGVKKAEKKAHQNIDESVSPVSISSDVKDDAHVNKIKSTGNQTAMEPPLVAEVAKKDTQSATNTQTEIINKKNNAGDRNSGDNAYYAGLIDLGDD